MTTRANVLPKAQTDQDDQDLIRALAKGEERALQVLFARHHTRVYRFILRQIGDEMVAEDIANEVFLACWKQAGRFEGRSKLSTWLMAIAYNKSISWRRKRREQALEEGQAEAIMDEGDSPQTEVMKEDKAAQIKMAMEQLSPDHKAVLDLAYYHEMSMAEIAEILDVPKNTVKTRLFHARKNLHQILLAEGIDRGWP